MYERYEFSYIEKIVKDAGFEILDSKYTGIRNYVIVVDEFGFKYLTTCRKIIFGHMQGKQIAHPTNPFSLYNISLWLIKQSKNFSILSTKYIGKDEDLLFQCLNENCKEKFYLSWTKIQRGTECRFCSGKLAGKNNSLINADKKILDDWDYNKNKKSPSEYSMKTSQEVWWKCAKCGHEWKSRIDVRTMRGRGCQRCNLSKGEKQIIFILDSKKIQYVIQKRFSDCKFYYTLPFDFYIPSLNLCIEYNGIQHYESVKHFGGLEHFGDVQNKDIIKGEYCKENNIKLVKIPYWDFDNIEKILSEFICCLGGC